jgi:protein-tyrosine phosphatase
MTFLMVCLGNICRSPLAEGILKHKAKEAGLNWVVESAGTGNYNIGEAPHRLSQKVAKLNGIEMMQQYDKIYVMDAQNYADVKRISGKLWDKSKTELILNEAFPGEDREVDDPYYDNTEPGFLQTFKEISEACEIIIEKYGKKETV